MKLCKEKYQSIEDSIISDLFEKNRVSCEQSIHRINNVYSQRESDLNDKLEKAIKEGHKTVAAEEGKVKKNRERWDEALRSIEEKSEPNYHKLEKALGIIIID